MPTPSYTAWQRADQPLERLHRLGPHSLAQRELLALVLGNTAPARPDAAIALADRVVRRRTRSDAPALRQLGTTSIPELCRIPGVGRPPRRILAAMELGRRAAQEALPDRDRLRDPRDTYQRMRLVMRDLQHEEFHVLLLNTQNEVLRTVQVTRGTLDCSPIHPREVFRVAITAAAASVILVHNHPSGDPAPSPEDRHVTQQLRAAGKAVGIEVLDHVIIGEGRYVSFMEAGMFNEQATTLRAA